jgi:hypothetical protein
MRNVMVAGFSFMFMLALGGCAPAGDMSDEDVIGDEDKGDGSAGRIPGPHTFMAASYVEGYEAGIGSLTVGNKIDEKYSEAVFTLYVPGSGEIRETRTVERHGRVHFGRNRTTGDLLVHLYERQAHLAAFTYRMGSESVTLTSEDGKEVRLDAVWNGRMDLFLDNYRTVLGGSLRVTTQVMGGAGNDIVDFESASATSDARPTWGEGGKLEAVAWGPCSMMLGNGEPATTCRLDQTTGSSGPEFNLTVLQNDAIIGSFKVGKPTRKVILSEVVEQIRDRGWMRGHDIYDITIPIGGAKIKRHVDYSRCVMDCGVLTEEE